MECVLRLRFGLPGRFGAVVVLAALIAGCSSESVPGDPRAGLVRFETPVEEIIPFESCAGCHSLDGVDGEVAPSLSGVGERAKTRVSGMSAAEYLKESIVDPRAYRAEGWQPLMSGQYGTVLTESEIDNLVAFLLTQ